MEIGILMIAILTAGLGVIELFRVRYKRSAKRAEDLSC